MEKSTFENIVARFGLVYIVNLYEEPVTISHVLKDSYMSDYFNTFEDALDYYKSHIMKKYNRCKDEIADYKKAYKNMSFWRKFAFENSCGENFKQLITRLEKEAENVLKEVDFIPQLIAFDENKPFKIYDDNPKDIESLLCNVGDVFYSVVTNWNGIDLGIYKGVIESVDYAIYNTQDAYELVLRATLEIKEPNEAGEIESHYFDLRYGKNGVESGHAYHYVFKDKGEALKFFEEEVLSKIKKLEKRLECFKFVV